MDGDSLPGRDLCWCCRNPAKHPARSSITLGAIEGSAGALTVLEGGDLHGRKGKDI